MYHWNEELGVSFPLIHTQSTKRFSSVSEPTVEEVRSLFCQFQRHAGRVHVQMHQDEIAVSVRLFWNKYYIGIHRMRNFQRK